MKTPDRPDVVVTVRDPRHPERGEQLFQPAPERRPWRPRRLGVFGRLGVLAAGVVMLVGAGAVVLLHDSPAPSLGLAVGVEINATPVTIGTDPGTGSGLGSSAPPKEYSTLVVVAALRSYSLVSARLDTGPWTITVTPGAAQKAHALKVVLHSDCDAVGRLTTPTSLVVTGLVDGRRTVQSAAVNGASLLATPRLACGYADPATSLVAKVASSSTQGRRVHLVLTLVNGSRTPARLLAVRLAGATVTPSTPTVLPPFTAGRPGRPVQVAVDVSYASCPADRTGSVLLPLSTGGTHLVRDAVATPRLTQLADRACA